tara:strand:+ start:11560 stop:13539 length:1980 start_codon:yes stop_codon:yes gene_type:complete
MAIVDVTKAKRNIDFDTFQEQKEGTRLDWQQEAKKISDAFTGVAEDRTKRKKDIDDDTKKNLDALNDIDQLDNKTLMDMTIDGTNSAANAIYDAEQKMKRGELRPQDFQKIKNNISSGFTQFQKNAKSWDADFKRFTERLEGGESSSLEQYLGERMESFGNLKNMQLVTNPDTGNLAFGRVDENGVLLTGPDDLISINRMTAISKQEINKVDVGKVTNDTVTELGDYIKAGNAGSMNKSGSSRAVVTIDDFMQTPQAEKYLLDKAKSITASPFETGSVLADNGVQNANGEVFKGGDQKQFDQWAADNPDSDAANPIIVMGYKENGVMVEPAITKEQQEAAEGFITRSLRAKLGREEKMVESSYKPNQKSNYELKGDRDKDKATNLYNTVADLVAGDAAVSSGAATELSNSINQANTGKAGYKPIQKIERIGDEFIIRRAGEEPVKISVFAPDGTTELSGDDIGGAIWDQVTSGDYSWDEARGDRSVGNRGTDNASGTQVSTAKIEQPDYATDILVDGKAVSIKTSIDEIDDLGGVTPYGARESVKAAAKSYQNILQEVFKNKNTPGLSEAFKGKKIEVRAAGDDGYNLEFQIGDEIFKYPQDVEGYDAEGGKTATSNLYDENSDIWPQVELFIDRAIQKRKGGGSSGGGSGDDILNEKG